MHINSTEYLVLLAKNDAQIVLEVDSDKLTPRRDFYYLANAAGYPLAMSSGGFSSSYIEIPRVIIDDFLAQSFVSLETSTGIGDAVFVLTADGRAAGLSSAAR